MDGYRCQLSKLGDRVVVYSRNGKEFTGRFSGVWEALRGLPAKSAIIDAEIVACRDDGAPDFRAPALGQLQRRCSLRLVL